MHGSMEGDTVHVPSPARERFYDNRGYGHPRGDALALSPVEAAHLLFRGDLEAVDGMGFRSFLATTDTLVRFLVYKDLRERGFYLSPARDGWVGSDATDNIDFVVYPRGNGPWDGVTEYRVRVVGERAAVSASSLTETLAVVDEESEITYFSVDTPDVTGSTDHSLPENVPGMLLADRVVLWDAPSVLYERAFYGQPLSARDASSTGSMSIQCSLVEAAHLAERGIIRVDAGIEGIIERGRVVEGDRFDRRRAVYSTLRDQGVVPKTGYKFGADFRTYARIEHVDELDHSEQLIRVVSQDHTFSPRDLALDGRLAHGVRKRMVFALTDATGAIDWRSISRLTP
ncbi:tRNA-intron lyase [Halocatena pleomorpha]|uniref:tRNA-splicing endonuclease n=1 Tax=Halocatena pleomorpha TaxID=1785090 RepID=A0A3P3R623_9EURY|nr:tRNA-intron lyase [Halocatena pleomorpha]RRJ28349.1 tRNA-intron lyase [Halocatena pleomorpha]